MSDASQSVPADSVTAPPRLLSEVIDEYVRVNPRISSPHIVRRYYTMAHNFSRFLDRAATSDDLNEATYAAWCRARRAEVASGTIRGEAEKLLVIWRWHFTRTGQAMPIVALPKKVHRTPVAWTPEEIVRLEQAALACAWNTGRLPGRVFWPAIIGVALNTGERIGAIHALEASNIDVEDRVVFFAAETRKGGVRR